MSLVSPRESETVLEPTSRASMYEGNAAAVIGKSVGNYVIERGLAQGNMGAVFVARHPALGREAAVKFLGRELEASAEMTKRFLDEARITASLRHPNIVDIFDFGELDGRLYYVMELLEGLDLAALLRTRQRFTTDQVVNVLQQVCSGLAAAHAVGVVHRDLKPGNIFVVRGHPPRLKLMDFGIAKILTTTGEQTHYGQIIGTPRYMCPEQALGQIDRITPQSDLYSLGVIAYEMLTGKCPFEHQSPVMLLVMHVHHEVYPLGELAPDTTPWLVSLVESCLAKDPKDRPASAQAILARIGECHSQLRSEEAESCLVLPVPETAAEPLNSRSEIRIPVLERADLTNPKQPDPTVASSVRLSSGDTIRSATEPLESKRGVAPAVIDPAVIDPAAAAAPVVIDPAVIDPAAAAAPVVIEPAAAAAKPTAAKPTAAKPTAAKPTAAKPTAAKPTAGVEPVAVVEPTLALEPAAPDSNQPGDLVIQVPTNQGLPEIAGSNSLPLSHGVPSEDFRSLSGVVTLTDADRTILNRLLFRMQRRGDFPAFVKNVGEVNKRADCEGSFSAEQLGTSILKDYSLTAKLLKIVNSAYANRFGGKIYSIRHAIVILGFDRVRYLALGTSLFKTQGNKEHSGRISESAINALVAGEIARQLSREVELDDIEQTTICSMFRNLGRHLVLVYLPELYDEILSLMEARGIGLNLAAEQVLGLSMHKVGVGIAERWRLPAKIIGAMSSIPERTGRLVRDEDKIAALADFSNQLCEIVVDDCPMAQRSTALKLLLNRHKNLVQMDDEELTELMESTQRALEQRYVSLLGEATRTCRFSRTVATLADQTHEKRGLPAAAAAALTHRKQELADAVAVVQAVAASPSTPDTTSAQGQPVKLPLSDALQPGSTTQMGGPPQTGESKPKPQIVRLQLAKVIEPARPEPQAPGATSASEPTTLENLVTLALSDSRPPANPEQSVTLLLRALAKDLNIPRLLALRATQSRRELALVGGFGDDVDGLTKELRLPLMAALSATDPFSVCYHTRRDFFIDDVFAPRVVATLPQRYFEVIGSNSLAIFYCASPGCQPLILLVDLDPPNQLPSAEQVLRLGRARTAIAKIAPSSPA